MTRKTNSRIAGFTFLFYIAVGISSQIVSARSEGGEGIAAKLSAIAHHASGVHLTLVLSLLECFSALVLAVTLYALTRDEDPDLAMLALTCRVAEGVLAGAGMQRTLALLWLATATGTDAPDGATARALGGLLSQGNFATGATFFAVGSTLFSWLLLRGRMIPTALAWIGVVASVLLVVGLPLQLAGVLYGSFTLLMWIPMLVFEVPLAFWLLIKGAAMPARTRVA